MHTQHRIHLHLGNQHGVTYRVQTAALFVFRKKASVNDGDVDIVAVNVGALLQWLVLLKGLNHALRSAVLPFPCNQQGWVGISLSKRIFRSALRQAARSPVVSIERGGASRTGAPGGPKVQPAGDDEGRKKSPRFNVPRSLNDVIKDVERMERVLPHRRPDLQLPVAHQRQAFPALA